MDAFDNICLRLKLIANRGACCVKRRCSNCRRLAVIKLRYQSTSSHLIYHR